MASEEESNRLDATYFASHEYLKKEQCKAKKRRHENSKRERETSKRERNFGNGYMSRCGKYVSSRRQKLARCNSSECNRRRLGCHLFSEDERTMIQQAYWDQGDLYQQRTWLLSNLYIKPLTGQGNEGVSRKNFTYQYFLPRGSLRERVCQKMFLNTLNISSRQVKTAVSKLDQSTGIIEREKRGGRHASQQKIDEHLRADAEHHIIEIFQSLASKNCSSSTDDQSLLSHMSVSDMHRMYLAKDSPLPKAGIALYRNIFHSMKVKFDRFEKDCSDISEPVPSNIEELPESTEYNKHNEELIELNMDIDEDIVTLEQVQEAYSFLRSSSEVVRTPTLSRVQSLFLQGVVDKKLDLQKVDLFLKMENMQITGSFKIRGVLNQMRKIKECYGEDSKLKVVTMSAGNYGKAFAHCVRDSFVTAVCVMPDTAPANRVTLIKSMGVDVIQVDTADIQSEVDRLVQEDFIFCHPFDDIDLIAGYASSALELLEDVPDPDIILVCCGGGGLVSGVAAGISLSKVDNCRVYAVEPVGAPTMYESFKSRRPVTLPHAKSIAAGLSPPYAGSTCYKHCRWFVDDVLLVSDDEILHAMSVLFGRGIKAEPSGCAALAALLSGKVPDVEGKKVVVYITGGNVSPSELPALIKESDGSCQS